MRKDMTPATTENQSKRLLGVTRRVTEDLRPDSQPRRPILDGPGRPARWAGGRLAPAAFVLAALLAPALAAVATAGEEPGRPDVLVIVVDDLNDWVTHLGGHPQAKTPNIDRLASLGVSFTNAHSPATSCNPSRAAVLTGLRPSTTGIYTNRSAGADAVDGDVTLPVYFGKHGYRVLGAGKVFHNDRRANEPFFDEYFEGAEPPGREHQAINGQGNLDWHALAGDSGQMPDHERVGWALERLAEKGPKPIFLAVGITRPHLPWWVPEAFFDLHSGRISLPRVHEQDLDDLPAAGVRWIRGAKHHQWITQSGKWRDAVRGYLAAVSFADHQVGRLIDGLERRAGRRQTVVVLWSDNGFHLGEKRHWKKGTLWEETTRTPLVFLAPAIAGGTTSHRPVDGTSIYPTLAALAGLPRPPHLEGVSLVPLLEDPAAAWSGLALTTHRRGAHAVRGERWRYIRYADGGEELYDHDNDPHEWSNLADDARFREVKLRLAAALPLEEAAELTPARAAKAGRPAGTSSGG